MCGISGFLSLADQRADAEIVRRMTAMLRHRGPDDEGFYVSGPVALGHRRLRIIDLETGQQPIANETGTVQVILNGEIYNFAEVRTLLLKKGHRFKTRSDTEVIVHAYEEFGEECVAHFNGMFSFALWDEERETLFLARDRMAKNPCTIRSNPAGSSSVPNSGRCSNTPWSGANWTWRAFRAISPTVMCPILIRSSGKSTSCLLDTFCPSRRGKLVSFATGTFSSTRIGREARTNGPDFCGRGCVIRSGGGS